MRTGYSQANLLIQIETVLGKDELLLYEFLGEEFISDTFVFNLKLRSSNISIETEKLLSSLSPPHEERRGTNIIADAVSFRSGF